MFNFMLNRENALHWEGVPAQSVAKYGIFNRR